MLEFETLSGDDIREVMETGTLNRPDDRNTGARPVAVRGATVPRSGKRFVGGALPTPQGA